MGAAFMEGIKGGLGFVGMLLPIFLFAGFIAFILTGINIKEKK